MKQVNVQIIDDMTNTIHDAILHFEGLYYERTSIKIYVPQYFREMMEAYFRANISDLWNFKLENQFKTFCGVEVILGYENSVIISVVDNIPENIKPIEIVL